VTVFVGKDLEEEQKEKEKGIFRLTLDKWSVFAYNEDNLGNVMREKREKEAKKCFSAMRECPRTSRMRGARWRASGRCSPRKV
jgi:hypothetical protein